MAASLFLPPDLIPDLFPFRQGRGLIHFFLEAVDVLEDQVDVFVLIVLAAGLFGQFDLDIGDFFPDLSIIDKHLPDAGEDTHDLNVDLNGLFTVQDTGQNCRVIWTAGCLC